MGAGRPVERGAGQSHWEQVMQRFGSGEGIRAERGQARNTEKRHGGRGQKQVRVT